MQRNAIRAIQSFSSDCTPPYPNCGRTSRGMRARGRDRKICFALIGSPIRCRRDYPGRPAARRRLAGRERVAMSGFNSMGLTNNFWGICGINSSLYALYQNNPALRSRLEKGALIPTMILAEIKTFLRMLEAEGKQSLLGEIESFTRTFNGFEAFTVRSYIERINEAAANVSSGSASQWNLLEEPKFSIALPPNAVVYYLQKICGFDNARLVGLDSADTELVLGLWRNDGDNMNTYNGLRHYVYYRNGTYYSWGQQFASIAQMQRNYAGICYKIAF
jgi:hypothetical protein